MINTVLNADVMFVAMLVLGFSKQIPLEYFQIAVEFLVLAL